MRDTASSGESARSRFSVIIPALNEADRIGTLIAHVHSLDPSVEIIVADGGSADGTADIAASRDATVVRSARGRGIQCSAGARAARGDILIFLHADTTLPAEAFRLLRSRFSDPNVQIGTFRLRFDHVGALLRIYEYFTRFDSIFTRFGDQCIVVRRTFYDAVGGFPEWLIFEDVHFLRMSRRLTTVWSFQASVITSSRRFIRGGIVRQQLRNVYLIVRYLLGATHEDLARSYGPASTNAGSTLIVFVRYPRPGKVKTRLAKDIGPERAAEVYRALAEHAVREARRAAPALSSRIYCDNGDDMERVREWLGAGFEYHPQCGSDLGERMANAINDVHKQGGGRVMVIGSDIPGISADLLRQADQMLETFDVVLGPSPDGGYYLIGMKRLHTVLFQNIQWSTPNVLASTIASAERAGLSVGLLPERADVDTAADLSEMPNMYPPEDGSVIETLAGLSSPA